MTHRKLFKALAGTAAATLLAVTGVSAQVVSHLNVVSDKSEDVSSIEAWKKTYIKEGMSEQDKAIAILHTLIRYRHQAAPPSELLHHEGHTHDPMKTIHVYGYNQCCCVSGEVMAMSRFLGMPARGRIIRAHSVPEVFYDNSWHLIDGSVMNCFVKPDGKLASVDEIHEAVMAWFEKNPQMLNDKGLPDDGKLRQFARNRGWKKGPALLAGADMYYTDNGTNTAGHHGWHSTMQEYYWKPGQGDLGAVYEYNVSMGYQLNVQLRPGERITRNWFSRGIEYTNKMNGDYYKELQDRRSLGIQTKLGDQAPGRVGDGTFEWNVPMDLQTLKSVALTADNLAASGVGVGVADASRPGVLELRFPSSYVYVKGQATVKVNVPQGGSVVVSYSENNGLDWTQLGKFDQSGEQTISLTDRIQRRYDYRLKFELTGAGTGIESLRTVNDFQCSQAALPTITAGKNTINFNAGPQEGTITIEGNMNPDSVKGRQVSYLDFHPIVNGLEKNLLRVGSSGKGEAIFPISTPGEITRIRMSATYRARDQRRDYYEVQVSFDGGQTFKTVDRLTGPTGSGSGKYIVIEDVPAGVKEAQLKLVGNQSNTTCLFNLRIDADYKEPAGAFKPVKITYTWEENGQEKTHEYVAREPQASYTIDCGQGARVKSFTMELAE